MLSYAIVFFPKLHNWESKIQTIRKKYDPHWDTIAPHITLVPPFSGSAVDQISNHIETVIKDRKSFPIHLQGLEKIYDTLLFLLVKEGTKEITTIYNLLYSGIFASLEKKYVFHPHITLGECDRHQLQIAYKDAQAINFNIYTTFDNISLIKGDETSAAQIIKTFSLV